MDGYDIYLYCYLLGDARTVSYVVGCGLQYVCAGINVFHNGTVYQFGTLFYIYLACLHSICHLFGNIDCTMLLDAYYLLSFSLILLQNSTVFLYIRYYISTPLFHATCKALGMPFFTQI